MRNYEELKKKYWIERNSIKEQKRYITKLLKFYKITDFEFVENSNNDDEDILINFKDSNYRIEMDKDNMSYKLYKSDEIIKEIKGDNGLFEMVQIILEDK